MAVKSKINLSAREKLFALFTVFALVWLTFELLLYGPKVKQKDQIKDEIEQIDRKIEENYAYLTVPDSMPGEIRRMEAKLKFYQERLLSSDQTGRILEQVALLCRRHGIEILSLRPQSRSLPETDYQQLWIQLNLKCDFKTAAVFMSELKEMPVYTAAGSLLLQKEKDYPRLRFDVVLQTFCSPAGKAGGAT